MQKMAVRTDVSQFYFTWLFLLKTLSILKVSLCKEISASFHFMAQACRCGMGVKAEALMEELSPDAYQSCKVQ